VSESLPLRFMASRTAGEASALWLRPAAARAALALAHGAGAGMHHGFLAGIAEALAERGVATLRYQFPYMEARQRRPDPPGLLVATVRAAVALAKHQAEGLPLFAGGKSLGGRMTTTAAAREASGSLTALPPVLLRRPARRRLSGRPPGGSRPRGILEGQIAPCSRRRPGAGGRSAELGARWQDRPADSQRVSPAL